MEIQTKVTHHFALPCYQQTWFKKKKSFLLAKTLSPCKNKYKSCNKSHRRTLCVLPDLSISHLTFSRCFLETPKLKESRGYLVHLVITCTYTLIPELKLRIQSMLGIYRWPQWWFWFEVLILAGLVAFICALESCGLTGVRVSMLLGW